MSVATPGAPGRKIDRLHWRGRGLIAEGVGPEGGVEDERRRVAVVRRLAGDLVTVLVHGVVVVHGEDVRADRQGVRAFNRLWPGEDPQHRRAEPFGAGDLGPQVCAARAGECNYVVGQVERHGVHRLVEGEVDLLDGVGVLGGGQVGGDHRVARRQVEVNLDADDVVGLV